jgi:putative salt-induced outer membrane protein YdiY
LKLTLVLLIVCASCNLTAQTIINAEKLHSQGDSLSFSFQLDYSGTQGNVVTDQLDLAPSFVKIGKKHDFKLFGAYSILTTDQNNVLNGAFGHLRHNYKITERLKTFEFYQRQFNEVLLLTTREVYGGGLRYSIINQDSLLLDFGGGLMYENEYLNKETLLTDEISETHFIRATIIFSFQVQLKKGIQINNVVYYQPHLADISDFRLLNDFHLMININEYLNFNSSFTLRFDSKPPSILSDFDSSINVGLGFVLRKK